MRSTDHKSPETDEVDTRTPAQRLGALVTELATKAGYDVTSGSGGRAALVRAIGSMSQSAVSRMLEGKTLPMPNQLEAIARAVHGDVRDLLVASGVISGHSWPKNANGGVLSSNSQPTRLTPEEAADLWGITDVGVRGMLVESVNTAIRLQNEADSRARGDAGRR
ncbi:XRE family transcriptional regulator [Streptomycetaceae bacterium NBC_01309]